MPKHQIASHADIESDLSHIEGSLLKIENPQIRYWLAQFVDLVAEGVVAVDVRATVLSAAHTAKRRAKLREGLARSKALPSSIEPRVI